jgi:hypothetical protein
MAAKIKITGDLELKIREFCEKGYNPTQISKLVNKQVSKGTIKKWAEKNGYSLAKRTQAKSIDLEKDIIEDLKKGLNRKQIQKKYNIHFTIVTRIALKAGIPVRSRAEASLDRILSNSEATAKLPTGNGKVIGYNKDTKKYVVQAEDGFIYYKSSGKLFQGDPRNKYGTKLTLENVIKQLDLLGYDYLDSWTIKRKPLRAICRSCGNIRQNRLRNFYFQGCSTCLNKGTSKTEEELLKWIKTFYPNACKFYLPENKTKPKEIDIYIPELKLGIEYCGLHWHCEDLEENQAIDNKHYKKMLLAEKIGIRLITIFENEWKERQDQVKGFLLSAMGKNTIKIYARDCEIVELDSKEASKFFEDYHIQGAPSASFVAFGLKYNGEIVGVMDGGGHPRRSRPTEKDLYLNRLCFKTGVTVVGGASKLFSALKDYALSNGFERIISWSDNRWSQGQVYKVLGFRFDSQKLKGRGLADGSIWPDFNYVIKGKLYSRAAVAKLGIANIEDIPKIYDCGKKRWVYDLKQV